ncbi:MAG: hypothetical protein ACR2PI_10335 [Hyphomicrobiaceae bacterium]
MVTHNSDQDRFATLLAAYGSDFSRWPADSRSAFEALSREERAALLREDAAFDQLIGDAARAAATTAPPEDLMARILAAAPAVQEEVPHAQPSSQVIELRRKASVADDPTPTTGRQTRDWVAAAALMAASLALGIFVGSTDRGQIVTQGVGDLAGVSLSAPSVQTTALDEALQTTDDEDIL